MEDQQPETGEPAVEETEYIHQGFTRDIAAGHNLSVSGGLALTARAGNDMQVTNSVAAALVAGSDMEVTNTGANAIVAGGDIEITDGGCGVMVVGGTSTVNHGFVGIIVSGDTVLGEGSQVLLNTPQAIAFGAALGAMFGVVSWLLRGRGGRRK